MSLLFKHVLPTESFPSDDSYVRSSLRSPHAFTSSESFKRYYLCYSFLRKWKGFNVGINLKETAIHTFMDMERHCFKANSVIKHIISSPRGKESLHSLIFRAQTIISDILGPVRIDKMAQLARFGGGATSDLRRGSTHYQKSLRPTITFDCIPIFCQFGLHDEYLLENVGPLTELKIIDCNRVVTVPKTSKTDRTIAAEPTLNSFVQQGIGRYVRSRLKKFGVDLDDQTINQDYAFRALVDGFATIDLSSASDTLCTNLVELLLPREWYELLNAARSHYSDIDGKRLKLEKFSSMGNAFTFELESLVFYALSSSAGDGFASVYGDDIIVKSEHYDSVVTLLTNLGFIINDDKSFSGDSRFFESCGRHYFDLEDVTPCYQKDVCRELIDLIRLHNRLVRAGVRLNLRNEIEYACQYVREYSSKFFGFNTRGPFVEYDEFFIDPDFSWSEHQDRTRLKSVLSIARTRKLSEREESFYYGRKLRQPIWSNAEPDGSASEHIGYSTRVRHRWHWRSASIL